MGYVAFWTASTDGASWYRADKPAEALGWQGHKTWVSEVLPASVKAGARTVVGSRIATPEASAMWKSLKDQGTRLVLDLDDDYFHVEPRNRKAAAFWNNDQVQWRLAQNCAMADVVTVASAKIGEAVQKATWATGVDNVPEVRVIENGLHAGILGLARDYDPPQVTIGWAGTHATAHDFDLVRPALAKIMQYSEDTRGHADRLSLVGIPINHPELSALGNATPEGSVFVDEWVAPVEAYHSVISKFDIWVAPYRDNDFTSAKFPTKALEAGFFGIPLIASDIEPYRNWITNGENGFLVHPDRPWEWGRCLKTLVDHPELRKRMGEAARSRATRNIMQDIGAQWEEVCFGG